MIMFALVKLSVQFKKGYLPNWSEEIFTIATLELEPEYKIKDLINKILRVNFMKKNFKKYSYLKIIVLKKLYVKRKRGKTVYLVPSG